MQRFAVFISCFLLLVSLSPAVLASGSPEPSEDPGDDKPSILGLFDDTVQIPPLPDDGRSHHVILYGRLTGFDNFGYTLLSTTAPAYVSGDDSYANFSARYSLIFSSGSDSMIYHWDGVSDSWVSAPDSSWLIHKAIFPLAFDYGAMTARYGYKIIFSDFHIMNRYDRPPFYFRTPLFSSLSFQWAFSSVIQFVCQVAAFLVPVGLLLFGLYLLIRYVKRMFRLYLKR